MAASKSSRSHDITIQVGQVVKLVGDTLFTGWRHDKEDTHPPWADIMKERIPLWRVVIGGGGGVVEG